MKETLARLRIEIDDVDQKIQTLLSQRAALAEKVGKVKQLESNPVFYRPERETEILEMVAQRNKGPLSDEELFAVFRLILNTCRNLQVEQHTKHQTTSTIKNIIIVGTGLIGSSIAKCLKEKISCTISGIDNNQKHLEQALAMGFIDSTSNNFNNIESIDLIIICTPADSVTTILQQLAPNIGSNITVTDVASTKTTITEQAQNILGSKAAQFIPSHPLAGRETSGPSAADSKLFSSKQILLTPFSTHNESSLDVVKTLWRLCGAQTHILSSKQHDQALSLTSHLPQMLSFTYMTCFENCVDYKKYGAGSFTDLTRIAASNPQMWEAICSSNKENILTSIKTFKEKLGALETSISNKDTQALMSFFELANALKKEKP